MWPSAPSTASAAPPSRAASPACSTATTSGACWCPHLAARRICGAAHERRQKRRAPAADLAANADAPELEAFLDSEPTPEFAAELAEECRRLLDGLGSAELARVALWKMEGYANEEIAAKLGCVPRTVERKLRLIRGLWGGEVSS